MSFLAFSCWRAGVLALASFPTVPPFLLISALFIAYHFLSTWPSKFITYRKPGSSHYHCEILLRISKCEYQLNMILYSLPGWGRNDEIKKHENNTLKLYEM